MRCTVTRFPYRGGNRNNGGNAGLGALNLNNSRTNSNNNIGLRLSRLILDRSGQHKRLASSAIKRMHDPRQHAEKTLAGRVWYSATAGGSP